MKDFKTLVALLKKHGYFTLTLVNLVISLFFVGMCFASFTCVNVMSALMFAILLCWNISEVCMKEEISVLKEALANANDNFVLADHEVERLRLELEAVQSELAKQVTHVQTGLAQTEEEPKGRTASIDTAEANADILPTSKPKPRPKRRPAPKRKPKQTEHENKD